LDLMHRSAPLTFLPWLRYMPPDGFGYWKMKRQAAAVHKMMKDELLQRIGIHDYKNESRDDLTSLLLRKMEEVRSNDSATEIEKRNFCEDKIAMLMTELFFAGIQTECNTFGWAFLYFVEYPDVQEKCRQQILNKFGRQSVVRWRNRIELPYVEATVMEVQRCANIAPFSVFHRNYHETTLDGYYIPANSFIMMNLYSTLVDPNCFQDPYAFKPERFLNHTGELSFEKMHGLYPYGLGRRICMGENIARCELFTVICALLQRYRFRKIPGKRYSLEKKMKLTIHPDKYKLLVEPL
uniref:Cytochrome n=1 Tax=Toxocara canis TaxID=6265 RepID=A0A183VAV6_TOXCA